MRAVGLTSARQLILDALHMEAKPPRIVMDEQDWAEFASLARMHRLGPMLHHRLRNDSGAIPQPVREQLQASYWHHATRNLNIYRELVMAARLLGDEGAPFIVLKGAFLAQFSYPEPGLRPMRDLDLLLHPDDAVRAFKILRAHGYESLFGGAPEAYFADRIHLPPLRSPGGVNIELHHRLTPPEMEDEFERGLWSRRIERRVGGVSVAFPCAEDMLLHLCIHATLDHQLDLGPLALLDVALLAGTEQIDWQGFRHRVRAGNRERLVLPLLLLAQRHLGARVPEKILAEFGDEDGKDWVGAAEYLLFSSPGDHKLLDYDIQEVLYAEKFSVRAARLAEALFPPRHVIARHFPVAADSLTAFLYYPQRWYRLASGRLPGLIRAHARRKHSLRQLALSRSAFMDWLRGSAIGKKTE